MPNTRGYVVRVRERIPVLGRGVEFELVLTCGERDVCQLGSVGGRQMARSQQRLLQRAVDLVVAECVGGAA